MKNYIALIHKDADSDFGVSFPDLPGVVTAGSTLEEASAMAVEALALHLKGMAEDGEAFPEPSTFDEVMAIRENMGAAALVIPSAVASKSVRINVTLPSDLLDEIDRQVKAEGFTRSGFLAQAAKKAIAA